MKFMCETCGKEVTPEEGTLSWVDEGNSLRHFRITHKSDQNHESDPQHVGYIHLWMVTRLTGFTKFTEVLADYWVKGYTLDDLIGLKRVLNQIGVYIWEESRKEPSKSN